MKALLSAIALLCIAPVAAAATLEEDVQRYIAVFQGSDAAEHNRAVEELAWMGISDPRLFDMLEQKILAENVAAASTRAEKDRVARYVRALGFSGQEKYLPTLRRFADDAVYGRYARDALTQRPQYEKWNPIISNRATWDPALSDDDNRILNMLRSDDLLLMRVAAKRAYFAPNDRVLAQVAEQLRNRYATLDSIAEQVRQRYPTDKHSVFVELRASIDALQWMIKALGKTTAYDDLLQEVKANAPVLQYAADSALRHPR